MAGARKRSRTTNGKKYKTYKGKDEPKAVICKCPRVCPDVMQVQLHYNAQKSAAGGGALPIDDYVFRGNGCFDPDFAVGGAQPLGYDQWSAFYRRYRVRGSKITVRCSNNAAIDATAYIVAMNTSSGIVDRNQIMEMTYSKFTPLSNDAGQPAIQHELYCSTAQVRGSPADIVQYEADLSALVTTTPTQEWFWHVGGIGYGSSANNFDINMDITVTYYVDFYDRETLSRS